MAMEDTMAHLAHSQVSLSLPSLADDIQGFQLIETSEENNSAIGVLVAVLGNLVIYIPAVFRKGKIYNLDIMYIPEMQQWLPTQDNWVTYLRSRRADVEAMVVDKNTNGGTTPGSVDLDTPLLKIIKTASVAKDIKYLQRVGIPAILKEAADELKAQREGDVAKCCESLCIPDAPALITKCAASPAAQRLMATLSRYPDVADTFVQYYSDKDLEDAAVAVVDALGALPSESTSKQKGTVKLLTSASVEARDLSDEQKVEILRDGAIIVDSRGITPTKIMKAKHTGSWASPDTNGVYELLKLDGSTVTAYVVPGPRFKDSRTGKINGHNYVIPMDDAMKREVFTVPAFILGQYTPIKQFNLSGGHSINSLPTDGARDYLIVDVDGSSRMLKCLTPRYMGKADGEVIINAAGSRVITPNDSSDMWSSSGLQFGNPRGRLTEKSLSQIVVIPAGGKLRQKGATLFVPANCRAFELSYKLDNQDDIGLATMDEYVDAVSRREKLLGIKIYSDPTGYVISDDTGRRSDPLSKRAAALDLVTNYVIPADVAKDMVSEVGLRTSERYLAKLASDSAYSMAFSEQDPIDPSTRTVDLNNIVDEDARTVITQAGQSGVKEVMDVTVLKLLAEDGSCVRMVQDMIPQLFSAMNAVGQLLFMLRAGVSMTEAYGEYRADEMEKQFTKLMQRLGDAVIVLQQGRVDEVKDLLEGPLSETLG